MARPSVKDRLSANSEKVGDCLEWMGYRSKFGYGKIFIKGKSAFAHRAAWEEVNGEIPDGIFCCHKCDNRACILVSHLFLGTRQDNIMDMVLKKRRRGVGGQKGEAHHTSKLKSDDVYAIRATNTPVPDLMKMYGISRSRISAIRNKTTWKHLN